MSNLVLGIAESINIMGTRSGTAMKERKPGPVQEMAKEETAAGAAFLDLNPNGMSGECLLGYRAPDRVNGEE